MQRHTLVMSAILRYAFFDGCNVHDKLSLADFESKPSLCYSFLNAVR